MTKSRYFIEKLANGTQSRPAVAQLSSKFHAIHIQSSYLFGVATMQSEHLNHAWDHSNVFLFPSMLDRRPIRYWLQQQQMEYLWDLLAQYGTVETDCGRDVIVKLTDHFDSAILELET